jgi:predicted DNA-binding transcriptional regulator YafY
MRCDTLMRCFQTIEALRRKHGVTAKELAEELGLHSRSAYRYLDAASLVLPVTQDDGSPSRFSLIEPTGGIGGRETDKMSFSKRNRWVNGSVGVELLR